MADVDPRERVSMLERERDTLRERLASFERGEPDAAYRAELKGLEDEYERLQRENEALRRRVEERKKILRARFNTGKPILTLIEDAIRALFGGR
jgi:DNA repair exonuclease SbcCD ATPase subunit